MNNNANYNLQSTSKQDLLLSQVELEDLLRFINIKHVHVLKALRRKRNNLGVDEHLREVYNLKLCPGRTIPKLIQQLMDFNLAYRVNPCSSCKEGCVHLITEKGKLFLSLYNERIRTYDSSQGYI